MSSSSPSFPPSNPLMPGLRVRHDGWSVERTRLFLAYLGQTGCVRDACRCAELSSTNAYRMRARFPLFAAEWDKAQARAKKGLMAIAWQRAVEGKETVIYRDGKEVERRVTPDSSILALLLRQGKLGPEGASLMEEREHLGADGLITKEEALAGWYFDDDGNKVFERRISKEEGQDYKTKLLAKLDQMRERANFKIP
jgi:hypothetical protein